MVKIEKTNVMRMLDRAKLDYCVYDVGCHDFLSGVEVANRLCLPYEKVFKTIVVQGMSKNYYVFCLPADKELDLKKCAAYAEEKSVHMIYKIDLEKVTGYLAGGCSPIGMKKQFKTWFDDSCLNQGSICFSAGKRGIQIEMNPHDLLAYLHAETGMLVQQTAESVVTKEDLRYNN